MKIWVIGRNYPEPCNNMTGSFEFEQAKMLRKNGEEVCYLCCSLHPNKIIKVRGYQSWQEDKVTVCAYSKFFLPRVFPLYFSRLRNRIWSQFLQRVYEENGCPDVIHVHYPAMLLIADALIPFKRLGVKIILTEHWTKVQAQSLDFIERKVYRKYFEYIDACICVGYPLADIVKKTIGDTKASIQVVPNIVSSEFYPLYSARDRFKFIAVGRLVQVKQFDRIVRAFSACFREKPVSLTIVGGGQEYDSLQKLINSLLMETQITLTGSMSRKQVAENIANADCLVCYSKFETFGVPIAEAWACGIPTITTTAAAVIDVFDNRLGVEVSYDNIEELKEKMVFMYENISLYDKKFISEFAQERFSEKAIYKQVKAIYMQQRELS